MTIITYTRAAKCKDCLFLKLHYVGNRKFHSCQNPSSSKYQHNRIELKKIWFVTIGY